MRFPLARPALTPFAALEQPAVPAGHQGLTAKFLGVSTVLVEDGTTALLTDGFFSRPGKLQVLAGRIGPDLDVIDRCLRRAEVGSLAAVICAHSHYDHAMDAPVVAERTGAMLLGSQSTANVGRGHGLPEERIRVVVPGEPMSFGTFTVTLIESEHSPHAHFEGTIDRPFSAPARAGSWAMGECYSIRVSAPARHDPGARQRELPRRRAARTVGPKVARAFGRPNAPWWLALGAPLVRQ